MGTQQPLRIIMMHFLKSRKNFDWVHLESWGCSAQSYLDALFSACIIQLFATQSTGFVHISHVHMCLNEIVEFLGHHECAISSDFSIGMLNDDVCACNGDAGSDMHNCIIQHQMHSSTCFFKMVCTKASMVSTVHDCMRCCNIAAAHDSISSYWRPCKHQTLLPSVNSTAGPSSRCNSPCKYHTLVPDDGTVTICDCSFIMHAL